MKLTAIQLVTAYNSLFLIKKIPMHNYHRFRVLRKMIKSFDEEYAIYQEKEQELIERYAAFDENGKPDIDTNGRIYFKTAISERDFINAKTDINLEIIDVNITPITITEDEVKMIGLSYESIEALEGIIEIIWNEEETDE